MQDFNEYQNMDTDYSFDIIHTPADLAVYIRNLRKAGLTPEEALKQLKQKCIMEFDCRGIDLPSVYEKIIADIYTHDSLLEDPAPIYQFEVDLLKGLQDATLATLLFSLLVYSRQHDHESGRIEFNQKKVYSQAGLSKLTTKQRNYLLQKAFQHKLYEGIVLGSKNPIFCYSLPWRQNSGTIAFSIASDVIIPTAEKLFGKPNLRFKTA